MTPTSAPLTDELLGHVDGFAGYVQSRLGGYTLVDIDDVLQTIRVTVWRCADKYTAAQGDPTSFVFGIARNVIRHETARLAGQSSMVGLDQVSYGLADGQAGPAEIVEARTSVARLLGHVADAATEEEMRIVVELALTGDTVTTLAARVGRSPRAIRAVREDVHDIASVVATTLARLDAGHTVSGHNLAGLLPARFRPLDGLSGQPVAVAADRLGLAVGTVRNMRTRIVRLATVATTVADREGGGV